LLPSLNYDGLDIADGAAASIAYAEMQASETTDERAELRAALLAYCKRDTLALLELLKELR